MYDPDDIDNRDDELVELLVDLTGRVITPYHRAQVAGLDNVPEGAALFVGNHNGGTLSIDTFIWAAALCERFGVGDVPYGLAHDLVVEIPPLNHALCPLGAVRASHDNARRLFERGAKIVVYPGGDIDATRPFRERNIVKFAGRTGFIKLALQNDVPVVPVVAHGAHNTLIILHDFPELSRKLGLDRKLRYGTFPLAFMVPWGMWFGPLPPYVPLPAKIRIEFLEPHYFAGGPEAASDERYVSECAESVRRSLQSRLTALAQGRG